ncbi:hypothetical protein L2E82_51902 [Cichorium intybus]|nr:hypothetical protein L2E82_51902 [Cichorium intybus]
MKELEGMRSLASFILGKFCNISFLPITETNDFGVLAGIAKKDNRKRTRDIPGAKNGKVEIRTCINSSEIIDNKLGLTRA